MSIQHCGSSLRKSAVVTLVIGLVSLVGCRTPNTFNPIKQMGMSEAKFQEVKLTNGVKSHHLVDPDKAVKIGVGDVLNIGVVNHPETQARCVVTPDGMLYYDIIGGIVAEGKTVVALEKALTSELCFPAERLLGHKRVRANGSGMDLIIDKVM